MKEIRHDGIIESIGNDGHICVRITQMAACAGCKVAAHCNASEQKVKVVDVYLSDTNGAELDKQDAQHAFPFRVGDNVVVATSQAAAGRALLLGFGLPLVLLLLVLAAMLLAGNNEGISAITALVVLLPYYLILWLLRNCIAGSISFKILSTIK